METKVKQAPKQSRRKTAPRHKEGEMRRTNLLAKVAEEPGVISTMSAADRRKAAKLLVEEICAGVRAFNMQLVRLIEEKRSAKSAAEFLWVDKKGNAIDESNQHRIAPRDSCLEILQFRGAPETQITLSPSDIKELRLALDHQG